jgi:hypothetical protein
VYLLHDITPNAVAILLTITSFSESFTNVVVDAIMCVQSRKDPRHGSQNLISLIYVSSGIGGSLGSVIGGLMT